LVCLLLIGALTFLFAFSGALLQTVAPVPSGGATALASSLAVEAPF